MQAHKIEKLLVVDGEKRLRGLITIKDIESMNRYPQAVRDGLGRLVCGAAVGVAAIARSASPRWSKRASTSSSSTPLTGTPRAC